MILLDTNVLSAIMDPAPDPAVLRWLDRQPASSVWTTTITLMELKFGLASMPQGRRREILARELRLVLETEIEGRIAPFDAAAADEAADLSALRKRKGTPVEFRDTMIAGIALATHATIATRNVVHYADLRVAVVNPWQD